MTILTNHGDDVLSRLRVFGRMSSMAKKAVKHYIFLTGDAIHTHEH